MSDLISRAEAIEAVCNECEGEHYPKCTQQKYCREVNEILELPSADRPTDESCQDCPIYSADRPTVIRSKTLMPTKDFKEWAKRIREVNPNAMIIPCDAEVVSADRPKGDPETEPAPVVAYICDRRRCAICSGPDGGCDHTTDIKHAAHFKNVAGQYFERPYMEEEDDGKDNDQG